MRRVFRDFDIDGTGRERTFVFSPDDGSWRPMGEAAAISLGWDGASLWGLLGTHLCRGGPDGREGVWEEVDPGVCVCTEGRLAVAAGRIWIAQQGAVRIGRASTRQVPPDRVPPSRPEASP